MEEKNYDYFIDELDGQYALYLEKEGRIIMREYGNYFDFNKLRDIDSLKWLTTKITTEKQVYDLLKKNNIKYKLISKRTDGYYQSELKILLEANQCYAYITYSPNFIISNMYYNAKDTLSLRNNFGKAIFRY